MRKEAKISKLFTFSELLLNKRLISVFPIRLLASIMPPKLENWQGYFTNWPAEMARRGILVTTFGEQIPFSSFWTSSNLLLLERQTPDSLGARMIVLSFAQVAALKIVDVLKAKAFESLGFEGPASKF